MSKKGLLIVVSGFSGAGKGTVMRRLLQKYDNYALSISATTRSPRFGEEDSRDYFFKTTEQFEKMILDGQLIEYAKYVSNFYGTPKDYVEEQLELGKNVVLEIEIQGALKVKEKFPKTVLLFLLPPSAMELQRRLIGRGTEDIPTIRARLARAVEESQGVEDYDYIVVNDNLDTCVDDINCIVESEHNKAVNNLNLIDNIREELKSFSEGVIYDTSIV